ncbi:MAG: stage II sporulation protein M [Defluviitaleaceae bacterium]|nr:stage II sporulation protein M [Defluviitaleaceae bacterium]
MTESAFISKNQENWKALAAFNTRLHSKGGIKKLTAEEVRRFAALFREVSFNLAYAKTHYPASDTIAYLNGLVGVSHNFFYVREKGSFVEIKEYFLHALPRAVREASAYWLAAVAVFVFGAVFAWLYVTGDASRAVQILPELVDSMEMHTEAGAGIEDWDGAVMSAFFITNNVSVALRAFAWGFLAGIGTLYILFYNGLIIGALFAFLRVKGADMLVIYSLILPHGILELAAIFIAGGAGLMLGRGILFPAQYTRRHALVLQSKKAAALIPCIVIMLVIAAFIEGYFTPLAISPWDKLLFAVLTGVGMVLYFARGSKGLGHR